MNQKSSFHKIRLLFGMAVFLAAIVLNGCGSFISNSAGNFNSLKLPNSEYFVGGGLEIEWIAPQAGTAYLVEEKTYKIVMTKSLDEGEEFEFSIGDVDNEDAKKIFGVEDSSHLAFSLYFIPVKKAVSQ